MHHGCKTCLLLTCWYKMRRPLCGLRCGVRAVPAGSVWKRAPTCVAPRDVLQVLRYKRKFSRASLQKQGRSGRWMPSEWDREDSFQVLLLARPFTGATGKLKSSTVSVLLRGSPNRPRHALAVSPSAFVVLTSLWEGPATCTESAGQLLRGLQAEEPPSAVPQFSPVHVPGVFSSKYHWQIISIFFNSISV